MKNFNWRELLRRHALFSALNAKEVERIIDQLLDDKVSEEREYSKRKIIVREGELADSVFLLGSGSVEVLLEDEDEETPVAILKQGEFFGEMALIERKPRAATVRAIENCTLLEINGQEFLKLLDEHRDVESKMLLKLSERLRHANEQVVAVRFKAVDEKLKLFNEKVDAEVKRIGASVTEVRALTDYTKSKADDIITSFERTRNWLTWMLSFITIAVTLGGMVSGGIGYWFYKRANGLLDEAQSNVDHIKTLNKEMGTIRSDIADNLLMPLFREALTENIPAAMNAYDKMRRVQPNLNFSQPLYEIKLAITHNEKSTRNYTELLNKILNNAREADMTDSVAQAYYLLLTNEILIEDEKFQPTFSELEGYIRTNKDRINTRDFVFVEKELFQSKDRIKLDKFLSVERLIRQIPGS